MKVKKLIELLQLENPDTEVTVEYDCSDAKGNLDFRIDKAPFGTIVLIGFGDWVK